MVRVRSARGADAWECAVEVDDAGATSHHTVQVTERDLERWGRADETVEQLVQRAFAFLLARESPRQILRSFVLSDIQRYFSEFDEELRR